MPGFLFGDADFQLALFFRFPVRPALLPTLLLGFRVRQRKSLLSLRAQKPGRGMSSLTLAAFGIGSNGKRLHAVHRRGKAQAVHVLKQKAPYLRIARLGSEDDLRDRQAAVLAMLHPSNIKGILKENRHCHAHMTYLLYVSPVSGKGTTHRREGY